MKSNLYFFVGVFSALLISWLGIVIGSNSQLGGLAPYYDDGDGQTHPEWMPGVAAQGQLVYRDLGCVACHTQQVRRPSFGSDQARGWGERQSVARDYIYQPAPQLGLMRIGPDLTNLADRKPSAMDADDLLNLLYTGSDGMPSYRFLFEKREVGVGAQHSERALKLTGALKPKEGWEIVPTSRAESLVGYLVNLKTTYTYPEATPFTPPKPEGEAAKPAAPVAATPAPGATPAPSAAPAAAPGAATPAPSAAAGSAPSAPAAPAPATGPAAGAAPAARGAATPAPSAAPAGAPAAAPAPAPGAATPAPSAAPGAATPAPPGAAAAPGAATPAPSAAPAGAAAPAPGAATPAPSAAPGAATPAPAAGAPASAPTAAPGATGGTK